jgi:hypothetical protein
MAKADYNDRLKDYVQVSDRIAAFYAKHPAGSIQSEIVTLNEKLVVVKAWAYRDADDARPGIGHSSLQIPGTTPYTRGSEVENAETSAWGRAIAALGFEVRKGIATRDEIENKHDESNAGERTNGKGNDFTLATEDDLKRLVDKAKMLMGVKEGRAWTKRRMAEVGVKGMGDFHLHQFMMLMNELEALESGEHTVPTEDEDIPF